MIKSIRYSLISACRSKVQRIPRKAKREGTKCMGFTRITPIQFIETNSMPNWNRTWVGRGGELVVETV